VKNPEDLSLRQLAYVCQVVGYSALSVDDVFGVTDELFRALGQLSYLERQVGEVRLERVERRIVNLKDLTLKRIALPLLKRLMIICALTTKSALKLLRNR